MLLSEYRHWAKVYRSRASQLDVRTEREMHRLCSRRGYLTKRDIRKAVRWKFEGDARMTKIQLGNVRPARTERVKELTHVAFTTPDLSDECRIRILIAIPGVKMAMASVLLTFLDPGRFCVFDRHLWKGLRDEGKVEGKIDYYEPEEYLRALEIIRLRANQMHLTPRELERAYYARGAYPDEEPPK